MTITRTTFYWRCRVLRAHDWVSRSTEDGGRHLVRRWQARQGGGLLGSDWLGQV